MEKASHTEDESLEGLLDGVREDIQRLERENETLKRGLGEYMGLRELALYSDLSISTLRGYIRRGILPCFKVEGKVLVKKSEFDLWIQDYRMDNKQRIDDIVNKAVEGLKST